MICGGLRTKGIQKKSEPEKPLITVVTVVFNGEKTLEQTIQSVVNQTYDNVEYIIIDGASTDRTLDIIKKYEDKIDYWQSESDKGIYDAMNKGIGLAKGEFLIFLGADDLLFSPNLMKDFSNQKLDINFNYYGDVYFNEHRVIYDYKFSKMKLCCRNICHQAIFYCKSTYQNKKFDTKYKIYADWVYNIESWNNGFKYIPLTICIFSELGSSQKGDSAFATDKKKLIRMNFGSFFYFRYLFFYKISRFYYFLEHIISSYKYK